MVQLRDLPQPKGLPVLGHVVAISRTNVYEALEGWAPSQGPLFTIEALGRRILVVNDGDVARQVIRARPTKFARYRVMRDVIEELGGTGVFTAEGEAWRRQRRLVMAGFNSRALLASFDRVGEITERFREHLGAQDGRPVDVVGELMRYTIDVTGAVALGRDFDTIRRGPDVLRRHLQVLFPAIARRMSIPLPYWRYGLRLPADRKAEASVRAVSAIISDLIREARARLESADDGPRNLIEALLLARDDDDPTVMLSDDEVFSNVLTILLAGEDTTANTSAWMLHFASRIPRVFQRLRAEAEEAFDGPVLPSHEAARKLPYTAAVAYEVGRHRPVGAIIFLEAIEDTELQTERGTVFVPANTPVFVMIRAIMNDLRNFGRPNEFLPERWLDDERPEGLAHSPKLDFSFGGGPRICPGRPLALLETAMVASMVAKGFDLEPANGEVHERIGFTLGPDDLRLRFRPRG